MEDSASTFVTIISSAGGLFLLQQIVAFIKKAKSGHMSWVRREVDKATKSRYEAEQTLEQVRTELGKQRHLRQEADDAREAMRKERETALRERDDEAYRKRLAYEAMHQHRLIIMDVAPERLPPMPGSDSE